MRKKWKEDSSVHLHGLRQVLEETRDFSAASAEASVKSWIERNGYNTGAVMNVFRLVIVGELRGPHLFDIIAWIGREETIKRIDRGLSVIAGEK